MRVSILASGSSGNITLLETERTRLLIDAGLGKRETLARLAAVEKGVDRLDGILVTHEHNDHCSGLPQMLGLWKAPLYVTEPTMDALNRTLPDTLGKRLRGLQRSAADAGPVESAAVRHRADHGRPQPHAARHAGQAPARR